MYLEMATKHGIGIYKWPDGTIYEGQWENNHIKGYGIIYFRDERIYMVQLHFELMHGYGEFYWPDGKKYFGFYDNDNDKKNGFGMFFWSCHPNPLKAYIGYWKNGTQTGVGMTINGKSASYGYWYEGRKDISFQALWEMKKLVKENNLKLNKFIQKDINEILSML